MSVRESDQGDGTGSPSTPGGDQTKAPGGGDLTLGNSPDDSGPSSSDVARCERVCDSCLNGQLGVDCVDFCGQIYDNAQQAGCTSALASLFRCHDSTGKSCSGSACPAENNALTVCAIEYCDAHNAALCSAPL